MEGDEVLPNRDGLAVGFACMGLFDVKLRTSSALLISLSASIVGFDDEEGDFVGAAFVDIEDDVADLFMEGAIDNGDNVLGRLIVGRIDEEMFTGFAAVG